MTAENDAESKVWVIDLQNALNRFFSEDDLESLCLSLDLDYEGLPGDSKQRKIVELIQFMVRSGRIDQLIESCGKYRPNVDWGEMLAAAEENPLRLETAFNPVDAPTRQPQPASGIGGLLRNRWMLAGIGGVVLIVILVALFSGDLSELSVEKQERVDALLSEVNITGYRYFNEDAAGWQVASPQTIFGDDFNLTVPAENSLTRSRNFGPGDAIIIDFELTQMAGAVPQVEFVLQTGEDRETASGLVVAELSEQVAATAVFNGETVPPASFDRTLVLETGISYTALLAVAADGRILTSFWDEFSPNLHSTFVYNPGAEWANSDWRFKITTPPNGEVVLDESWDLAFDSIR